MTLVCWNIELSIAYMYLPMANTRVFPDVSYTYMDPKMCLTNTETWAIMITTDERTDDTVRMRPTSQFPTVSPLALRQHMVELNRSQEEIQERLRQQEKTARNAVRIGVISLIFAAFALIINACLRTIEINSYLLPMAPRSSTSSSTL